MTPQQLATLKTYILAQPDLSSEPMNGDGHFNIAVKLNIQATPDAFTWKNRGEVNLGEIMGNGYVYDRIDNLTVGRARIWDEIKTALNLGEFTANSTNHRAGITSAFNQAADSGMRLAIFGHMQRFASRFERLYTASNGATTNDAGVGPIALVVPGPVTPFDVESARTLP